MKHRSFIPFIFLFAATSLASAADPTWWATRGVKNTTPASNLSPATIGQAKHMAAMALAELQTQLSPADYSALQSQVAAIVNLTTPQTQTEFENQRMVLLTGQLKAMAKPFYDKLRTLDAAWLDNEMVSANIRVVEPGSNPIAYSPYPWSVATADDQNKAVANLGQLKAVFSLRFETIDTDHDGLPDAWERLYFQNLDHTPEGDADGDGLSNARERDLGWNPSVSDASVDTDSDGMPDAWELRYFPNLDQTPDGDPDGDGLTNATEFPLLSNPNNPDTDGDGMGDGYEEYYELSVNSPENIPAPGPQTGPDDDKDGDGKTNQDEWDGGSIPLSPGEWPKFTYPPASLKWFGVAGKVYFVEWTTDFNTWNTLPSEQLGTNHEIAFLPTTGFFFRLRIYLDADEDTDADGLPDWREIEKIGTDPDKMDSDEDGLNDDEELERGTDPNNPNSDNDDLLDGEDADPKEALINWKAVSETAYLLIDVDAPLNSNPVDLNAKGEVLFDHGIWSGGQWTALPDAEDQGGPHPDYFASSSRWTHLGDDGSISGESQYTINDGGPDLQGVPMVMFAASRASALSTSASILPAWESGHPEGTRCLEPLGVASNCRIFAQRTRLEANPRQRSLVVLDQGLQMTSSLVFDSGHDIKQADVARNGSVIALLDTDSGTGTALELAAWDSSGAKLTVPAAQGYHCDLHATELAEGGTVMTAWSDSGWSKVYVPSQNSTMSRIDSLSASNIVLFAGDGTAMTDDHHLWRNGKLIPLRDLCQRFGELLDEGWYLQPLKSNKHGVYLVQADGPNGEKETKIVVPVIVKDNAPNAFTGVDDVSRTAKKTDIGRQGDDYWIMAPTGKVPHGLPSGDSDCANDTRFFVSDETATHLKIEPTDATVSSANPFPLAVATPKDSATWPTVTWHGIGATTKEADIAWHIGTPGPPGNWSPAVLPVKVTVMKQRTVNVAVWVVKYPGAPDPVFAANELEEFRLQIRDKLNRVYAGQINAWFDVNMKGEVSCSYVDGVMPAPDNSKYITSGGAQEKNMLDEHKDTAADINLYFIKNVTYLSGATNKPLAGHSYPSQVATSGAYANRCLVDMRNYPAVAGNIDGILQACAHEIGHLLLGPGHPDDYKDEAPERGGIAPLQSLPFSVHQKRLMTAKPLFGDRSTLLVKAEWDEAEKWLHKHVDEPDQ